MAKQIGAMPISGKIDNLVYYNTKNGGAVVRRAYPNLGKRVKTDKVYANTRRNNAEFGMCGYVASQLLSPILQRWKYILKPDAVGELTKTCFECLQTNTAQSWGERSLTETQLFSTEYILDKLNSLSKNEMSQEIKDCLINQRYGWGMSQGVQNFDFTSQSILSVEQVNQYIEKGFTTINVYAGGISMYYPVYNTDIKDFLLRPNKSFIAEYRTYSLVKDSPLVFLDPTQYDIPGDVNITTDPSENIGGIIVLLIPRKLGVEYVEEGSFFIYYREV